MSKKISSRGLSAKQVQELIQSSEWSINNALTTRLPADIYINAIYSHPDGRTLTVLKDGAGRLYNSHEDWLSHLASLEHLQHQEPVHILQGRLPQGQDFARIAPSLVEQLARELHIPVEQLNRSRASLESVDQAIHQKERYECLLPEVFAPLVAYLGEVVKSGTDLDWEMRLPSNGTTWEPWLVSSNRSFPIASMVYDELSEEPDYSVSAIADVCFESSKK
jgi:hypothetical protein